MAIKEPQPERHYLVRAQMDIFDGPVLLSVRAATPTQAIRRASDYIREKVSKTGDREITARVMISRYQVQWLGAADPARYQLQNHLQQVCRRLFQAAKASETVEEHDDILAYLRRFEIGREVIASYEKGEWNGLADA